MLADASDSDSDGLQPPHMKAWIVKVDELKSHENAPAQVPPCWSSLICCSRAKLNLRLAGQP